MQTVIFSDKIESFAECLLDWYFNVADSATSIKSSWEPLVNASHFGGNHKWVDPMSEGLIHNIAKKRKIEHALAKLSPFHQRVLYYSFSDATNFPPEVLQHMKQLSATSLLLNIRHPETIISLCRKHITNQASTQDRLNYQSHQRQAEFHYQDAIVSFFKAYKGKP